jgi:hypothetical protein
LTVADEGGGSIVVSSSTHRGVQLAAWLEDAGQHQLPRHLVRTGACSRPDIWWLCARTSHGPGRAMIKTLTRLVLAGQVDVGFGSDGLRDRSPLPKRPKRAS